MRFLSAIYLSSILSWAAIAAPLLGPARDDVEIYREVHIQPVQLVRRHPTPRQEHDNSALPPRLPTDVLEELDITARDPKRDAEVNARFVSGETELTQDRGPQGGGCVIA
ncbi:hypothetical protein FB451DRAFT_1261606 [Mycena latifolia]|nr:hypothetical protein FB451DRAFT_1261606 [Mycena latifolia]